MADPLRLYGLKALVTSAGSGVGEAIARTLVKHGAHVLAVDNVNSGVEQQFANVKNVDTKSCALGDATQMQSIVEDAVERLGGIDILINDFPPGPGEPVSDTDDVLDRLLKNRAELVMGISRAALPHLKRSPAGRIVSIGFLRSVFAANGVGASVKAEQDLGALSRALAAETGEFGITANYVQPGAIMTPASRDVFRRDKALRDHCIAHSAAHRLGEPVDVAKVVLFLASDDAGFVSGTGISVDGGRTDI